MNARAPDSSILVCGIANTVHGIDRATGARRWSAHPFGDTETGAEVELAIADGVVIAACGHAVAFIDYLTGGVHAAVPLPEDGYAMRPIMLIDGGHVYVSRAARVCCFTLRGQLLWNSSVESQNSSMSLAVPGASRQGDDRGHR